MSKCRGPSKEFPQPAWLVGRMSQEGQFYDLADGGKAWVTHVGGSRPNFSDAVYVGMVTARSSV